MDKSSFNLLMSNLAIGLFKNHSSLKPLSDEISKLGFSLFSVESSFSLPDRIVVQPEMIFCSIAEQHTLLCEWTSTAYPENKTDQLLKYLKLNSNDLKNYIAVPASCSRSHGLWFVVAEVHSDAFLELLQKPDFSDFENILLLATLSYDQDGNHQLSFKKGTLNNENLDHLLKKDLIFTKVPSGYLRVVTSDLGIPIIIKQVSAAFTSNLIKRQGADVTCEEIAQSLFEIWDHFDARTQSNIIGAIHKLFNKLFTKSYAKKILRKGQRIREWGIVTDGKTDLVILLRRFKNAIERFDDELSSGAVQMEIDFS